MFNTTTKRLELRILRPEQREIKLGVGESVTVKQLPAGLSLKDFMVGNLTKEPWKIGKLGRRVIAGVVHIDIPVSYQGQLG